MMEFGSPYSLDECVQRLQTLNKGRPPISARSVNIRRIDENTCAFRVERWAFFNLVAQVEGTLVFQGKRQTRVNLTERLSLYPRIALFLYGVACVVLIAVGAIKGNPVTLLGGGAALIWGFMVWLVWSQFPKRLAKSVKEILS